MAVLVLVACAALAVIIGVNLRLRAALPSHTAKRRLAAQLAEVGQRLTAASVSDQQLVARQITEVRQRWIHEQMTSTPVEALDIPGTGPSTHQALRDHGIATLFDLGRLGQYRIPGIGEKKGSQLLAGQRAAADRILDRAAKMSVTELDAYTQGRLGAVIRNHEADELERRREVEDLRILLTELERRRQSLDG